MHINGTPPILQHSYASFQLEEYTDKKVIPENTNLMKDEGGPTLIERNGKFYQIIVNVISGTPDGNFFISGATFLYI
uniref:Uncharacterized protein n=1 Tax=Panagrolaimus superbus TaxID=310955 RepID=A0A914Y483_9BILA